MLARIHRQVFYPSALRLGDVSESAGAGQLYQSLRRQPASHRIRDSRCGELRKNSLRKNSISARKNSLRKNSIVARKNCTSLNCCAQELDISETKCLSQKVRELVPDDRSGCDEASGGFGSSWGQTCRLDEKRETAVSIQRNLPWDLKCRVKKMGRNPFTVTILSLLQCAGTSLPSRGRPQSGPHFSQHWYETAPSLRGTGFTLPCHQLQSISF
ncbi:hypothetical protein B0T21DRAFT_45486 [Apiosordaria backusii]|uniref:Uncharacterized protein n=1 Tax=Apiosordaria backusii TaxID=314023 RepID=A0AA40AXT2_9PEZI|nr:hypothetical protein B0T21DRAFT_45486 [Apiosordaria backusii]